MSTKQEIDWRRRHQEDQALRRIRKEIGKSYKEKRVRPHVRSPEDWESLEDQPSERISARGAAEERRQRWSRVLQQVEASSDGSASMSQPAAAGLIRAQVVEISSGLCRVSSGDETVLCSLRSGLTSVDAGLTNAVAVGDYVDVLPCGEGRGQIQAVVPRRTALTRPDVFLPHLQQVIAANVDQILVVSCWQDPAPWYELIDRYLISAMRTGLQALLCMNKVDLAAGPQELERSMAPYLALGLRVLFTSTITGQGIGELRQLTAGKVTVLAGLSGVGKSSLLMAVAPNLRLRTSAISDRHHAGRHTTTQARWLPLPQGGAIVDTPGIREFGLAGLHRTELASYFPELAALQGQCAFANCSHINEPGCAIRQEVDARAISAQRYDSYCKIYQDLA